MKLTWKQIEPFLRQPDPAARVILVYGPDDGLMRERAAILGKKIVADLNDPFNAVTLSAAKLADDPARLADEAGAISMMDGARLIRIEDADDTLAPLLKDYLAAPSPHNLVILEAGALGSKSPLRALCEKSSHAAALPCYVEDEKGISFLIRDSVRSAGCAIDADALAWLAGAITGDRGRARSEIEKLLTYMGEHKKITLDDVRNCCGDAGAQSFDDLIFSAGGGQPDKALRAFATLLDEGVPAIAVLRSLQNHFRRLHVTRARVNEGMDAKAAMKLLSPPLFFKFENDFQYQVARWKLPALETILARLYALEATAKQTGTPVETLCAQALLSISARS